MPSAAAAAATTGHHSTRRRLPGVTILALCMLTAGWIAFAVLAPSSEYTDFESQATHFDAVAGRGDPHDAGRGSGAAPPTPLHRVGLAAGTGKQRVELAVDPSTGDDEALAFTVQRNNIPSSNAFSHAAAPRSARDSLTSKLRIKLDRAATLLGDLLLGLFGIDDGAEWFSEGDFDYEASQSGLDGGTLSSWSESSVYVEVSPFLRLCTTDKAAAAADDENESASTIDGSFVEGVPKVEEDSDEDLELLVSRTDPIKIPIDEADEGDNGAISEERQMWNELAPAEHKVIQDLHAAVADIDHNLPDAPRRRGGDSRPAPPPVPAQPQPPAQRQQQVSVDEPSRVNAPTPSQSSAFARPAGFVPAKNSAPAQPSTAATAYVLNSPPPPKKRQREHSPTFSLDSDDHAGSHRAPAPKRQKLELAPARVGAAKSSARPRHSAPASLRAFQHDSPVPTPGRRVPRASLAAVTQAASASPAPPPAPPAPQPQPAQNMQRAPNVPAERLPSGQSADVAAAVAHQQQQQLAAKTAPKNAVSEPEKPAAAGGLKLKELLALLARKYCVPQRAITNLIFCTCARCDPETLEDLVRWFVPAHRPLEGTPEYERLAGLVAKHVWTLREDTIALEGSETAVAQLEAKRGKQAIKRRVLFLGRANIKNVASLRKDLYNFRV